MKKIIILLLVMVLATNVALIFRGCNSEPQIEYVTVTDTVTITELKADTIYLSHYDTVKLECLKIDTVLKSDSVFVKVPISTYEFDTVISDTNSETHLKAVLSGFNVSLDTLSIGTKTTSQVPCLPSKTRSWYERFEPAVGVGIGNKGFGIFFGIGYSLN